MELDVDGSPRAYAPGKKKFKLLDSLENAKDENGNWCGIVTEKGKPVQ